MTRTWVTRQEETGLTHRASPQNSDRLARGYSSPPASMNAITERLDHSTLLVADLVWQLETEVLWMIYVPRQAAMHWRRRKELHVWAKIVPS